LDVLVTERAGWEFDGARADSLLCQQFGVLSAEGLGVRSGEMPAIGAAGALLSYLRELQPGGLPQLARPMVQYPGGVMPLDEMTRRNLELVESLRSGDGTGTLLSVLDRTKTPMGARLLRQWILSPLTDLVAINARLDAVDALVRDAPTRHALLLALDGVRDVERLSGKTAAGRASPRDVRILGDSLGRLPDAEAALRRLPAAGDIQTLLQRWDGCSDLAAAVQQTLVERPPLTIGDGSTISAGVDATLDELRSVASGGKDAIALLQSAERARTGIGSLKVGYNKVFGYFIEVTNANAHLVPADYQRRQTLTGAERYVTPDLKEFEEKVLHATERIDALEQQLFGALRATIGSDIARLQMVSGNLAKLDALTALAEVASREGYVRPTVADDFALDIVAGRHPVVEQMMARDQFIPNDVHFDVDSRMIILTGPNMAGKSTILRQIGLIVLMAQMGSFVPALRARIGVADRVFTRVGASDNLVRGQSTFMVEMSETSAILHTATDRSLVLLDEIGRGTSTWDGVSIAWAVSEYLHEHTRCKTMFATHYHELTQLADEFVTIRNYNVEVKEVGERILFLHRLRPGGADRSYGIEVGRLAGLPQPVITRARSLLKLLEGEQLASGLAGRPARPIQAAAGQPPRLAPAALHPAVIRLRGIDADRTTPLEALALLGQLVDEAKRDSTG
jgi:DNA mismatch repair protein MutS